MPLPLLSLADAIATHVPDGASIALGLMGRPSLPTEAVREIARQQRTDLTLIVPAADDALDPLIAAGCVRTLIAAEIGEGYRASPALRRAAEERLPHELELRDHSLLTLGLAFLAGALGVPFIPTYSGLGSELSSTNTDLVERINPLNERGEPLLLVRALTPDVALLRVARASTDGRSWQPGPRGMAREGAQAARRLLLIADEIVPEGSLAAHDCLVPPALVTALIPNGDAS